MSDARLAQKLDGLERDLEALSARMADPAVAGSAEAYRELATRYAEIEPVVSAYRELRQVQLELQHAREMQHDEADEELRALARDEAKSLEARAEELDQKLRALLLPRDPVDDKDVVLEVRAGTGGSEASLFAAELMRMYQRYAEAHGWRFELVDISESEVGGIKEAIANVSGRGVYSRLKFESGVHRVQRVPETEAQGRIHTSAATVAVLPEAEEVDVAIDEDKDLKIDTFCASGPGGQHVNKTASAVRITHLPSGIVVQCQDEKSWHKNKAKALKVLRARVLDRILSEQHAKEAEARRSMVRTGDRSEKIRTYNFPQNRVTDHRIGLTLHQLDSVMQGSLDELIEALATAEQAARLSQA
ncbi:MAG: peptide chain release factor 1 [Acidobacteria bacterium]|nr:peptide chain release factor 1 [Acidobacteriota bacterium]